MLKYKGTGGWSYDHDGSFPDIVSKCTSSKLVLGSDDSVHSRLPNGHTYQLIKDVVPHSKTREDL